MVAWSCSSPMRAPGRRGWPARRSTRPAPRRFPVLSGRAVPGATPSRTARSPRPSSPPSARPRCRRCRRSPASARTSGASYPSGARRRATAADESPLLLGEGVVRLLAVHGEGQRRPAAARRPPLGRSGDARGRRPPGRRPADPCRCSACAPRARAARPTTSSPGSSGATPRRSLAVAPLDDDSTSTAWWPPASPPPTSRPSSPRSCSTHSDGSPFLVEELLAGLVAAGELRLDGDRWTASGGSGPRCPPACATRSSGASRRSTRRRGACSARHRSSAAASTGSCCPASPRWTGARSSTCCGPASTSSSSRSRATASRSGTRSPARPWLGELLPPERRDLAGARVARHRAGQPRPARRRPASSRPISPRRPVRPRPPRTASSRAPSGRSPPARSPPPRPPPVAPARWLRRDDPTSRSTPTSCWSACSSPPASPSRRTRSDRALLARLPAAGAPPAATGRSAPSPWPRAALTAGDARRRDASTPRPRTASRPAPTPALRARVDAVGRRRRARRGRPRRGRARSAALAIEEATATGAARRRVRGAARPRPGGPSRTSTDSDRPGSSRPRRSPQRPGCRAGTCARAGARPRRWPRGDIDALRDTRDLAARYGALVTVAVMDLSLADIALSNFDRDGASPRRAACVEASRALSASPPRPVAHLWLAGAHALAGDDDGDASGDRRRARPRPRRPAHPRRPLRPRADHPGLRRRRPRRAARRCSTR